MNPNRILFDNTLSIVNNELKILPDAERKKILVIRDMTGRIRFAIDDSKAEIYEKIKQIHSKLGLYSPGEDRLLLYKDDLYDSKAVFNDSGICQLSFPEESDSIRILDRQVTGQNWLLPGSPANTPCLVFYGFKGGVGRSTALVMTAFHLAKDKKVLLIDLDLESPGLSSLILPEGFMADYGLVDWFVEDGVGQGDIIVDSLIANSPLIQNTDFSGSIKVVSAFGQKTNHSSYLSKLSRVYGDINKEGKIIHFPQRIVALIESLKKIEKPDVILIDSRAGLHDLSAISIVLLSSVTYLFATGSPQNWEGYKMLFSHWQRYPEILKTIRDRLAIVHALFPETNQENRAEDFLEKAYNLFNETIYEEISPDSQNQFDVFNYQQNEESAPHFPARIRWNTSFVEFSPDLIPKGIITPDLITATFGNFFDRVDKDLLGGMNE